jgi:hypothetical protein
MPERTHVVDGVDWTALTRDPRVASGVPAALHTLWSDDEFLRRSAYNFLARALAHQGERTPVSIAAVPFLIDVLADPAAGDRFGAAQLLRMIAIGEESYWLVEHPDGADRTAGEQWNPDAYAAVRAYVPAFLAALATTDAVVRLHTAHLLAWFPEERDTVVPALARVIAYEPGEHAEVAAVAAVAAVLAGGTAADTSLVQALDIRRAGPVPTERWASAIGLTRLTGWPSRAVLEQLYECLLEADDPVPNWPYLDGDMATLAALTLSRLDPSLVGERVDQLVSRLRRTRPGQDRATLIGALVDAAFPQRGAKLTQLTDIQLAAVRALIEADAWGDGSYVVSLLAAAGLPADGPPRF